MLRVSQAFRMASLSRALAGDGQESVKKLARSPLTFLFLSGNTFYLASILASAVGFLEGYSVSDLEADKHLVQNSTGERAAYTELKLVPYTHRNAPMLVSPAPVAQSSPLSSAQTPLVSDSFSIPHVVANGAPHTLSTSEVSQLQRFKESFKCSALTIDHVANELLHTTDSVVVAKTVLRLSSEVGLTIPRSTLVGLVGRLKHQEASLLSCVYREFAFEANFEMLHQSTIGNSQRLLYSLSSLPRGRKESKLERLRRSTSSK